MKYQKRIKETEHLENLLRYYFKKNYKIDIKELRELSIEDIYTISRFSFLKERRQEYFIKKPKDLNLYHYCKDKEKEQGENFSIMQTPAKYLREKYIETCEQFFKDFDLN